MGSEEIGNADRWTPFRAASWEITTPTGSVYLSPCGMVMDLLRSCYTVPIKLDPNSEDVALMRWFWAEEGAKHFPVEHRFASLNWEEKSNKLPDVGEQKQGCPDWNNGANINGYTGQKYCGDLRIFQQGINATDKPLTLAYGTVPECCLPVLFFWFTKFELEFGCEFQGQQNIAWQLELESRYNFAALVNATSTLELEFAYDQLKPLYSGSQLSLEMAYALAPLQSVGSWLELWFGVNTWNYPGILEPSLYLEFYVDFDPVTEDDGIQFNLYLEMVYNPLGIDDIPPPP